MNVDNYNRLAFISLYFSGLCILAVTAFNFPQYLSTPSLREVYDTDQLRIVLFIVLHLSLSMALISIIFSEKKLIALIAMLIVILASIWGGAEVHVETPIPDKKLYLSLDLIVLDMLAMSIIFVPLERFFYLRKQRFLREGLATDLLHYTINHLFMGGLLVLITIPGIWLRQYLPDWGIEDNIQSINPWLQAIMILFVADFFQYWTHRYLHVKPRLWMFHKIHHSVIRMDWIASSRLHIIDILITRSISYIPIVCLGFSQEAFQLYLPIVALQALFVHSNIRFTFGPLRYLMTTPIVHHWHHSNAIKALDKNFAVSFSCIDVLFGTFYCPKEWPESYGLYQEKISKNFVKQLFYPFLKQFRSRPHTELTSTKD